MSSWHDFFSVRGIRSICSVRSMLTESVICSIVFIDDRIGYFRTLSKRMHLGKFQIYGGKMEYSKEELLEANSQIDSTLHNLKFLALSEEKQTTIRNAALACFAKHGYEKASVNDIAMAADVSKASIFQYFGNKQSLYKYLLDYCASQMKQAYDISTLDANEDFFDRVWEASVMKVENLKKHPHIASFIASAAAEQASEVKGTLFSSANEKFIETLVLRNEDCKKFKRPEDAGLVFQMFMLLAQGMAVQLENGADYDRMMADFKKILIMLKYNFYKEKYL